MDQRSQDRVVTDRQLTCLYGGVERPIFVYNLSSDGCMALLEDGLEVGHEWISIILSSACEASGRLVWRHGSFVGIAFARKLDRRAIDRIAGAQCLPIG